MKKEKSCGAVVYRINEGRIEVLLIHAKAGHWCLSKGHVENNETEVETAKREILEETGIIVSINSSFRTSTKYSPSEGIIKEVVYFIATPIGGEEKVQEEEVQDMLWLKPADAYAAMTYENDSEILKKAMEYLEHHL